MRKKIVGHLTNGGISKNFNWEIAQAASVLNKNNNGSIAVSPILCFFEKEYVTIEQFGMIATLYKN